MSGGRAVPTPFGDEVGEELGRAQVAHPVVRVRSAHAVLGVLVGLLTRARRGRHSAHRTRSGPLLAVLAVLALVAALLGLPASQQPAAAAKKVTFTVALTNDADSFNPFLGIEAESYEMWALTYDYMIHYSMKDMSPRPGLAKSWDTSSDGKTWTFHIRSGVKWSDGKPFTAADIAYTYNRILDGGPEAATWASYLTSVTKVTAPDATTVVLRLKKPNAVLPLLPIPIIPEHVWKHVSEKQVKSYSAEPKPGHPVVGEGPFRLVEGTAGGSTYRFEANKDYWGGAPHVDEVVFRVFKSDDPAVQALVKGEVDFVEDITPLQVKALQKHSGITAINGDSPGFDEIAFNTGAVDTKTGKPIGDGNPALKDPRFRYALGFAVDRNLLIKKAYQGAGKPGTTIIPPAYSRYHWEPPKDVAFSFDPKKAGELLDAAGYKKGPGGQRTMPDGSAMKPLRLYARSESKTSIDTLDFFKEWLGDIGIPSKVTAYEGNKLTNIILDGDFDVFQWGWYVEPDPDSMLSYMTCGQRGSWSDSWYCNPRYDALYKAQNAEMDQSTRTQDVTKMQEILYKDAPYLVTAYNTIGEAVRSDRFACLQPQPDPGGIWLMQYGAHNYLNVRPAGQAGDCDGVASALKPVSSSTGAAGGGSNTGLVVGGGVAVLVLLGAGGWLAMRRRATAADRA